MSASAHWTVIVLVISYFVNTALALLNILPSGNWLLVRFWAQLEHRELVTVSSEKDRQNCPLPAVLMGPFTGQKCFTITQAEGKSRRVSAQAVTFIGCTSQLLVNRNPRRLSALCIFNYLFSLSYYRILGNRLVPQQQHCYNTGLCVFSVSSFPGDKIPAVLPALTIMTSLTATVVDWQCSSTEYEFRHWRQEQTKTMHFSSFTLPLTLILERTVGRQRGSIPCLFLLLTKWNFIIIMSSLMCVRLVLLQQPMTP